MLRPAATSGSSRVQIAARFVLPTLTLLAVAGLGAASCASPRAAAPDMRRVPKLEFGIDDNIPDFDCGVDDRGTLHVAWIATRRMDESSLSRDEVWYCSSHDLGHTWTQPVRLTEGGYHLRLALSGAWMHLVVGPGLRHLVSRDRGATWVELPPLLAPEERASPSFDVLLEDSILIVPYLARMDRPDPVPRDTFRLACLRWSPSGIRRTPYLRQDVPDLAPLRPRIVADRGTLHLVYAVNRGETQIRDGSPGTVFVGSVYHLCSRDGLDWTDPQDCPPSLSGAAGPGGPLASIGALDVVPLGGRLLIALSTGDLLGTAILGPGGTPELTVRRRNRIPPEIGPQSAIAALAGSTHLRIAWLDVGQRREDSILSAWLHGAPWSDDPYWTNDDVLCLDAPRSGRVDSRLAAVRLTPDLSYASSVRMCATPTLDVVMWSGRKKVGKTLKTYGEPPGLFFTTIERR